MTWYYSNIITDIQSTNSPSDPIKPQVKSRRLTCHRSEVHYANSYIFQCLLILPMHSLTKWQRSLWLDQVAYIKKCTLHPPKPITKLLSTEVVATKREHCWLEKHLKTSRSVHDKAAQQFLPLTRTDRRTSASLASGERAIPLIGSQPNKESMMVMMVHWFFPFPFENSITLIAISTKISSLVIAVKKPYLDKGTSSK